MTSDKARDQRALDRDASVPSAANEPLSPVAIMLGGAGSGAQDFFSCVQNPAFAQSLGRPVVITDAEDGLGAVDMALLYVSASEGVRDATRNAMLLAIVSDVQRIVVLVGDQGSDPEKFAAIKQQIEAFAGRLGSSAVAVAPLSGRDLSARPAWHSGPTLAELLAAAGSASAAVQPFRLFVEQVETAASGQRVIIGVIARGSAQNGDAIAVLPEAVIGNIAAIERVEIAGGAAGPQRAAIVLDSELPVRAGDVVCARGDRPEVSDQVAAHVHWLGDHPMLPGRPYDFECAGQRVGGSITTLKHRIDADLDHLAAKHLDKGDIGFCNLSFSRRIVFEPHGVNGLQGSVRIIDRLTQDTVGIGFIRFGLWRATNVHWQALDINKSARAESKGQKPCCLWFTGLSGSGKSTIANMLEKRLHAEGRHTYILDGDNVRHGLNRDLGFTDEDRVENIRRVSEVARLFVDSGLIVMVSFISPFRAERRMARGLIGDKEFMEIFVDTPLAVCEERDPKGLYKKARQGIIKNFTGIDSGYEPPEHPELKLNSAAADPGTLVDEIYGELKRREIIS